MVEIIPAWEPDGDNGSAHRHWAQELWQNLAPFALPGGYANLLGPDDREQAAHAYGGNGARLRALKRRFDPDGVFASAIPLPGERVAPATILSPRSRSMEIQQCSRTGRPSASLPSGATSRATNPK